VEQQSDPRRFPPAPVYMFLKRNSKAITYTTIC